MKATCQVTHLSPGRIRLHLADTATQPEVFHRLVQFVLSLPEVTRVELEPTSASVTILHARNPHARDAILQALRGTAVQGNGPGAKSPPATPALPETPPQQRAPTDAPPPAAPVLVASATQAGVSELPVPPAATALHPAQSPYANGEVVHAMRGRLRMRIPVLQTNGFLAGVLAHHIGQQPGVRDVRVSRLSSGIAIAYDAAATDARSLAALVGTYQPDATAIANWKASQIARRPGQRQQNVMYQISLALALVALALNYLGAPGVLVFAFLLAGMWPIFRRAFQTLAVRRQLSLELLAVMVMLFLWVTGRLWPAVGFVMALTTLEWFRSSPHRSLDTALASGFDQLKTFSSTTWNDRPVAAPRNVVSTASSRPSFPLQGTNPPGLLAATNAAASGSLSSKPQTPVSIAPEVDSLSQR